MLKVVANGNFRIAFYRASAAVKKFQKQSNILING